MVDDVGLKLFEIEGLISEGSKLDEEDFEGMRPASTESIEIYCYTSGTTGIPKAAMLTHKNWVSQAHVSTMQEFDLYDEDITISYLPLAHVFEKLIHHLALSKGSAIGYYGGQILKLVEDIRILRPTFIQMVPRLLTRIYDKIQAGLEEGNFFKRKLFSWGMSSKLSSL